jgi:hypothetical protein
MPGQKAVQQATKTTPGMHPAVAVDGTPSGRKSKVRPPWGGYPISKHNRRPGRNVPIMNLEIGFRKIILVIFQEDELGARGRLDRT